MKISVFLILFLGFSFSFYCQTNYKKGHVVYKNTNIKVDGFFKKVEWDYPPSQVFFKSNTAKKFSLLNTSDLNEFGITDESKYIIREVTLDKSTDDNTRLTLTPELNLEKEILTLEVIVEGDKILYKYENKDFERFFYSMDNLNITQLYYKKYNLIVNENNEVVFKPKKNTGYILQLRTDVSCNPNNPNEILPSYDLESLKQFFIESNKCTSSEVVSYSSIDDKATFNLNIIGGASSSQILATSTGYNPEYDFAEYDRKLIYLIGAGLEITVPSKKVSLVIETLYATPYKATAQVILTPIPLGTTPTSEPIEANYSYLRSSLGARYNMFLSNSVSFYLVGNLYADIPINPSILVHPQIEKPRNSEPNDGKFKSAVGNIALGFGFKLSKLSFEVKTGPSANLTTGDLESKFKNIMAQLNYNIF